MNEKRLTVVNSYTVVGAVVVGAGWYLYRLARGPEGGCFYSLSLSLSLVCGCILKRPSPCVRTVFFS